jgi:tetrahydromethanopterin S-methyltransferase subunit G
MTTENVTLVATKLAAETASKAADLATVTSNTAVALASKTAESMGIISTDISWMKKSLAAIESKLDQMDKAFVTAAQHSDVLKRLDEHDIRITSLETEKTRQVTLLTVAGFLLGIVIMLIVWHILQSK